jgi:multidrug efflux system membrane fusion protein
MERMMLKPTIEPFVTLDATTTRTESPSRKNTPSVAHGLFLFAAFVCFSSSGCSGPQASSPAFERPPAPVTVAEAVRQDVPNYLDALGKCVAREVVSIHPQVSGRITEIHFTDGANVKKGDPLFTIDPRPFEANLQQTQANLARNLALKKQAEANLAKEIAQAKYADTQAKRYAQLAERGVISREQYEQVQTNADTLNAAVNAGRAAVHSADEAIKVDEAAIESAKVELSHCYIRSPIDGRAGQRLVDIGNVVGPGNNSTPLLVIQRLDPIYADFTISQNDLSAVQQHLAHGGLKAEVRLPDEPNSPVSGQLTFLDNAVQDTTGTVNLRATIPNSSHRFWPGRFVNVRLVLSTLRGAVLVPATAPQMSANGAFVYVVKQDATAEMRPVTTGQRQGELVVIEKGVEPGERVVTNGQLGVTPGGKVQIEPQAPKEKSEIRIPKSETISKSKTRLPQPTCVLPVLGFEIGSLEFVSDFRFRASDFPKRTGREA